MLQQHVMSYFDELESLKEMSIDANKAFMDILVLAVIADGEVTEEELAQLDEELLRLPFIWDKDVEAQVTEHSALTRELLSTQRDEPGVMEGFLNSLAHRIDTQELREVALRMFIAVAQSDGFRENEMQMCHAIGDKFGFDGSAIDSLIAEIAETL